MRNKTKNLNEKLQNLNYTKKKQNRLFFKKSWDDFRESSENLHVYFYFLKFSNIFKNLLTIKTASNKSILLLFDIFIHRHCY